jgi:hypothetical protein
MKVFFAVDWIESEEGHTESRKLLQLLEAKKQALFDAYAAVDSGREEEVTVKLDETYFVELNLLDEPDPTYLEMSGAVEEEMIDARILKHQTDSELPMRVGRLYEVGRRNGFTEVKPN